MTPREQRSLTLATVAAGVVVMAAVVAKEAQTGQVAGDFALGLYPQAERLLHTGHLLEPAGTSVYGENTVYTALTTLLAAPLTIMPVAAAKWVATAASIALLLGALAVLGVRDARVYGIALAWPPVCSAVQTAQATPVLVFLLACAVRARDRPGRAGALVGVAAAVKLLVLPFAAWVIALRRPRAFAAFAVVAIVAGPILFLPFDSPVEYFHLLRRTADVFEEQALSPYVLLGGGTPARIGVGALGIALGVAAAMSGERRSLPLATASCILLSPIVWQHYYALLLVPLAALRPKAGPLWLAPLALWVVPFGDAATWQLLVVMAVFATITLALALRPETGSSEPAVPASLERPAAPAASPP